MINELASVSNPNLIIEMNKAREALTEESRARMIDEILKARFLVSVKEPEKQETAEQTGICSIATLENVDHQTFYLAFTDLDSLSAWNQNAITQVCVMSFRELAQAVLKDSGQIHGIVINPYKENAVLFKTLILKLYESLPAQTEEQEKVTADKIEREKTADSVNADEQIEPAEEPTATDELLPEAEPEITQAVEAQEEMVQPSANENTDKADAEEKAEPAEESAEPEAVKVSEDTIIPEELDKNDLGEETEMNQNTDEDNIEEMQQENEEEPQDTDEDSIGVLLTEPEVYPALLTAAVSAFLKKQKNVRAAYIRQMTKEERTSYLIVVDFSGSMREVLGGIINAAEPYLNGMPLDLLKLQSGFPQNSVENIQPFYKKKILGIF